LLDTVEAEIIAVSIKIMEIQCTRIGCPQPLNLFPELSDSTLLKTVPQRNCLSCDAPLILDGRYIPIQRLRQGGFGTVFLAYDRRTPKLKRCIVKQLQFNPHFTPEQIDIATKLFHREAEVLETLGEHPRIPRFFAFLELPGLEGLIDKSQKSFYLVQDYIAGQDLQQELHQRGRLPAADVLKILRQLLEILDFLHNKDVIHRDIKPSNIVRDLAGDLHLIDFGAVKQIVATGTTIPNYPENNGVTGICTPEYAPAEQRQSFAIYPSSDLYALGVTCLQLLTGEHPPNLFDYRTNSWQWDKIGISEQNIVMIALKKMLKDAPIDRYQSAQEALQALYIPPEQETTLPQTIPREYRWRLPKIGSRKLIGGGLVTSVVAASSFLMVNMVRPPISNSYGAQNLLGNEGSNSTQFSQLKAAGVSAMAQKKYPLAIEKFQAALNQNPNAPETRIYLNNALVGNQPSYTIAASVPITEETSYRALEMLRGFAQAQESINNNQNKTKVKIEIFNDEDKIDKAEGIARDLANRSDVLGVVGHNSSALSLAAAKIHNSNKLVFITPISIASNLTGGDKPYVFRTNLTGESVAQKLTDYVINDRKKRKVAIFYVPGSTYSEDLSDQFSRKLSSGNGEVVGKFELSQTNPERNLQQAISNGAEAIALFPTQKHRTHALNVLRQKQRKHPNVLVIGDIATLYHYSTLQEAGEAAQGMVMGVSWHVDERDSQFARNSRQLWKSNVNWATATSYDAVKAIGTAIQADPQPSRLGVKNNLSSLKFDGSMGSLRFYGGEPTERVTLVTVDKTSPHQLYPSGTGHDFKPVSRRGKS
jgi:ABC-type branched-subunit amino acid transport system substrate-binding protein